METYEEEIVVDEGPVLALRGYVGAMAARLSQHTEFAAEPVRQVPEDEPLSLRERAVIEFEHYRTMGGLALASTGFILGAAIVGHHRH